ncbi:MAG: SOS response-associated peptidase [Candidatus Kapabacteria bacterium]|jgi:putative SOS response-associated peptidase YedK|nr:SOS response-associated peptidase [Candidatus Kapabacteria bacterium]
MCFTVSIYASTHVIETDLGATFDASETYEPYVHVSGFVFPALPIVTNSEPHRIGMAQWGLVPRWVNDTAAADELRSMTLNARSETMFEKPAFRDAAVRRRGLIPVNGFLEWRTEGSVKRPYHIRAVDGSLITLGVLWDDWLDRNTGEVHRTFSIATTAANTLMAWIHNAKQRMPVIVERTERQTWLFDDDKERLKGILGPLPDGRLIAEPVSKNVARVKVNRADHNLLEPLAQGIVVPPDEALQGNLGF